MCNIELKNDPHFGKATVELICLANGYGFHSF